MQRSALISPEFYDLGLSAEVFYRLLKKKESMAIASQHRDLRSPWKPSLRLAHETRKGFLRKCNRVRRFATGA